MTLTGNDGTTHSMRASMSAFTGTSIFGGLSADRTLEVACGSVYTNSDPNRRQNCDLRDNGIPWVTQLKLAGSTTMVSDIQLSVAFQSTVRPLSPTFPNSAVWVITPTTRYQAGCAGPCVPGAVVNPGQTVATMNVPLEAPFSRVTDRINQLENG